MKQRRQKLEVNVISSIYYLQRRIKCPITYRLVNCPIELKENNELCSAPPAKMFFDLKDSKRVKINELRL